MKRRRGYALIEMVIIIGAIALLFGLCVGLIHTTMRLDRAARSHINEVMTVDRLARRFREDSRSARSWKASKDEKTRLDRLELDSVDGRAIQYQAQAGKLSRIERKGDAAPKSESYRLQRKGSVGFAILDDKPIKFAVLTIPVQSPGTSAVLKIEAQLGKDMRLVNAEGGTR
ncbi:hypothetical protein [Singulisphaera sp. PoT]|uniref:hypothetical protein n=1 Tax=Singulisphaera sp. PoT TaxID=3411797 RepID=UPI003BF52F47